MAATAQYLIKTSIYKNDFLLTEHLHISLARDYKNNVRFIIIWKKFSHGWFSLQSNANNYELPAVKDGNFEYSCNCASLILLDIIHRRCLKLWNVYYWIAISLCINYWDLFDKSNSVFLLTRFCWFVGSKYESRSWLCWYTFVEICWMWSKGKHSFELRVILSSVSYSQCDKANYVYCLNDWL